MSSIVKLGFDSQASIRKDFAYFKFIVSILNPTLVLDEWIEWCLCPPEEELFYFDFQGVFSFDSDLGGKNTV